MQRKKNDIISKRLLRPTTLENTFAKMIRHYLCSSLASFLFFFFFILVVNVSAQKKNDFSETLRLLLDKTPPRTTCLPSDEFVRVSGDRFILNNKPFTFAGWNQWEVVEAAWIFSSASARNERLKSF